MSSPMEIHLLCMLVFITMSSIHASASFRSSRFTYIIQSLRFVLSSYDGPLDNDHMSDLLRSVGRLILNDIEPFPGQLLRIRSEESRLLFHQLARCVLNPAFVQVVHGIYASCMFPNRDNIAQYASHEIKTVVNISGSRYSRHVEDYFFSCGINMVTVAFDPVGVDALLSIMMSAQTPMVVHSSNGFLNISMVIAYFRKIQGWGVDDILEEWYHNAGPPAETIHEGFIDKYVPGPAVLELAREVRVNTWSIDEDAEDVRWDNRFQVCLQ